MAFFSPAADHAETRIDVLKLLTRHPAATFYMRAQTACMEGLGIRAGDVLVIDRSIVPRNGAIVVATVNGEFLVRQLVVGDNRSSLINSDGNERPIAVEGDVAVWGTVTFVIHPTHATPQADCLGQ